MRLAVIGHVEHVTLGRVPAVPLAGEIAHLASLRVFPGGGGGLAFFQLARSADEVHLFTALGNDEAAAQVEARLLQTGARVHAARRQAAHTRDLVLIDDAGERTIFVVGEPLHPERADALPWDVLATCDAAYFTAQDPLALRAARAARVLVVTARRREALAAAGVRADVVVGSALDPREAAPFQAFPTAALVLTEGKDGGSIQTAAGTVRFAAPPAAFNGAAGEFNRAAGEFNRAAGGSYGAGDSFAGALTWYLAAGLALPAACAAASLHGAAVLSALDPTAAQLFLPAPA